MCWSLAVARVTSNRQQSEQSCGDGAHSGGATDKAETLHFNDGNAGVEQRTSGRLGCILMNIQSGENL